MFCAQPTCTCECIWLKTLIIESRQTSKHSCETKQKGSSSAVASSRETTQIIYLTTPFYHDHYYTTYCRAYWSPHGSRAPTALSFDYVVDPSPGRLSAVSSKLVPAVEATAVQYNLLKYIYSRTMDSSGSPGTATFGNDSSSGSTGMLAVPAVADSPDTQQSASSDISHGWIELPAEAVPEDDTERWNQFKRPVVRLVKAMYGHPDAGTFWEQHCNESVRSMGW